MVNSKIALSLVAAVLFTLVGCAKEDAPAQLPAAAASTDQQPAADQQTPATEESSAPADDQSSAPAPAEASAPPAAPEHVLTPANQLPVQGDHPGVVEFYLADGSHCVISSNGSALQCKFATP